jgi:hypothetical protein
VHAERSQRVDRPALIDSPRVDEPGLSGHVIEQLGVDQPVLGH